MKIGTKVRIKFCDLPANMLKQYKSLAEYYPDTEGIVVSNHRHLRRERWLQDEDTRRALNPLKIRVKFENNKYNTFEVNQLTHHI